jgi:hypothetical protein
VKWDGSEETVADGVETDSGGLLRDSEREPEGRESRSVSEPMVVSTSGSATAGVDTLLGTAGVWDDVDRVIGGAVAAYVKTRVSLLAEAYDSPRGGLQM